MSTHPVAVQRRQQRRRNALWVTLAIVLAMIVLLVWAFANLTTKSSEGPPSVAGSKAETVAFTSPDKSVTCMINTGGPRCTATKATWKPTGKGATCPQTWYLRGDGEFDCGQQPLTATTPLAYGDNLTRGDFVCQSRQGAMRCINTKTQHGFSLSKTSYMSY